MRLRAAPAVIVLAFLAAAPGARDQAQVNAGPVAIDTKRTCLSGEAVAYDLTSDAPAKLALSDGRTIALTGGRAQGTLAAGR